MNNKKVKFLIIRLSSIGDIVLTTPVIRGLKQQVEGAEVHFLVKSKYKQLIVNNPFIDKVHEYDSSNTKMYEFLNVENFDHIIDLQNNLRTKRIKNQLKVPDFSVNKLKWEKTILKYFKINRLPDVHIVDRYMDTVIVFDVKNDGKGLDYYPNSEAKQEALKASNNISGKYVSIAIGGQHATKKLPSEKLIQLCSGLKCSVVLLGGEEDAGVAELIVKQTSNKEVLNLCGKISLDASAEIVKNSSLVITHDTGMMHIAAAYNKIIFSVWGNTIPLYGMYPYQANDQSKIFEIKDLKCRPCSNIGYSKCPKKHFKCMINQNVELISNEANAILDD